MALSGTFYNYATETGFGLKCDWSATQSKTGNYSDITLKTYVHFKTLSISERDAYSSIYGTKETYQSAAFDVPTADEWTFRLIHTQTVRVNHNADGTRTGVVLKASWDCQCHYSGEWIENVTASTTVALDPIDRAAPTVTLSIGNITSENISIQATSSKKADKWDYRLNGGSWVNFSSYEGQSVSTTITGLTPNTTYSVQVRARRKVNHVYGSSSSTSVSTLGGSIITSASRYQADATERLLYTMTVFNASHTHTLTMTVNGETIFTTTGITGVEGSSDKAYTLSASERTALLEAMPLTTSTSATYTLTTYDSDNNIVGVPTTYTGEVWISSAFTPEFTLFSVIDNDSDVTAITGDNTVLIADLSSLRVNCVAATAKTGTVITRYKATIGEKTATSPTNHINFGKCSLSGDVVITVEAVDGRGLSTAVTQTLSVMAYSPLQLESWSIARQNSAEAEIVLSFAGHKPSILVNGVEKNGTVTTQFRTKLSTAADFGAWSTISGVTVSGSDISYNGIPTSLNIDKAYYFELKVTDAFSDSTVLLYIQKGTPLMAFRSEKIGINKNNPQTALDVAGIISMNGEYVMGFVELLDDVIDLDNVTENGLYTQSTNANATSALHYPAEKAGWLEVIVKPSGAVMQRYTINDCSTIYLRSKISGSWGTWKSLTLS